MRRENYSISYFVCPNCENILPLPRNKSLKREKNHIKDLYCFCCKKDVKATEIRNGDCYIKNNKEIIHNI